ncbi:DUF2141 domain-containing protein [Leisingera sp. F5]|uniref:DUF2141 domain-containing protein n=1 Tax=Leisingera sp. F5 TaxID=1813816 RepID=UPI000AE94170|nr:DUF2141 domain-containing protein [Leisingera sp. F5]
MLPRKLMITAAIGLSCTLSASALAAETGALTASIDGIRNSNGVLVVAAFDDATAFEAMDVMNAAALAIVPANEGRVSVAFHDLPTGSYAIAALHDEDSDGDFDLEGGVPTEGYSFASMGRSGLPPRFGDALTVAGPNASRTLTLRYWN